MQNFTRYALRNVITLSPYTLNVGTLAMLQGILLLLQQGIVLLTPVMVSEDLSVIKLSSYCPLFNIRYICFKLNTRELVSGYYFNYLLPSIDKLSVTNYLASQKSPQICTSNAGTLATQQEILLLLQQGIVLLTPVMLSEHLNVRHRLNSVRQKSFTDELSLLVSGSRNPIADYA